MQQPSVSERRGFEGSEWFGNSIGVLLVKAPIERASPVLARCSGEGLTLETDVLGQIVKGFGFHQLIFQYCGHPWTILYALGPCEDEKAQKISEELETRCIFIAYEDTSNCSEYRLFNRGKNIEEYHWGTDYKAEMLESMFGIVPENLLDFVIEREAAGNPVDAWYDPRQWDICWDTYYFEDWDGDSYWFRSTERTATKEQIRDSQTFLDTLLRDEEAWLPGADYAPITWSESSLCPVQAYKAEGSIFIRVDVLVTS